MPSGYTAGILDDTIKTFDEFAKKCLRAFGAAIHMRDDSYDKEYYPRKIEDYYTKSLEEAKIKLKGIEESDEEMLFEKSKLSLENSKLDYFKYIEQDKIKRGKLEAILTKVNEWTPPTETHEHFKKFMIKQLEETIDHDCNENRHKEYIASIENDLKNLKADEIKARHIEYAKEDVTRATERLAEEVERCKDSNEWAQHLFDSLNETKI